VTDIEQLAPGWRLGALSQPPDTLKLGSPPLEMPTLVRVSRAFPVFVTVTDCCGLAVSSTWLPKERAAGERVTAGAPAPVPVRPRLWGLPLALSVMLT